MPFSSRPYKKQITCLISLPAPMLTHLSIPAFRPSPCSSPLLLASIYKVYLVMDVIAVPSNAHCLEILRDMRTNLRNNFVLPGRKKISTDISTTPPSPTLLSSAISSEALVQQHPIAPPPGYLIGPGVLVCAIRGGGRSEACHCFCLLFFFFSPTFFFFLFSFSFFLLRFLIFTHFGETPVTENLFPPISLPRKMDKL